MSNLPTPTPKVKLDDGLLQAADELRQRIEAKYGIRASVGISLWYPPESGVVFVGAWKTNFHARDSTGAPYDYTTKAMYTVNGDVCVYLAEAERSGFLVPPETDTELRQTIDDEIEAEAQS